MQNFLQNLTSWDRGYSVGGSSVFRSLAHSRSPVGTKWEGTASLEPRWSEAQISLNSTFYKSGLTHEYFFNSEQRALLSLPQKIWTIWSLNFPSFCSSLVSNTTRAKGHQTLEHDIKQENPGPQSLCTDQMYLLDAISISIERDRFSGLWVALRKDRNRCLFGGNECDFFARKLFRNLVFQTQLTNLCSLVPHPKFGIVVHVPFHV